MAESGSDNGVLTEDTMPVFHDALFRQKRKHGKFRVVEPPHLERPVADTHAHVHLLADPALELAKCAVHHVGFVCDIVDIQEDDQSVFDAMGGWLHDAQRLVPEVEAQSAAALAQEAAEAAATGKVSPVPAPDDEVEPTQQCATCALSALCLAGDVQARQRREHDAPKPVPHVRFAVGCHPHNAKFYTDDLEKRLRARLADGRVSAVGEIGLDYHYDFSTPDEQREAFRRQIRLAHETGLPVALHVREAHDEAFAILKEEGFPEGGTLLHCFDLDWDTLAPWIDAGCFVAFGGALTFKRCADTREAAAKAPVSRLLTETDSPYMTPEPMRGVPCGPAHVVFTAARLAQVRGAEPGPARGAFLDLLMENARGLLDREPTAWQRAHAATTKGEAQ